MAVTPEQAEASMIQNFKANTGKDLDAWLKIAAASKLSKHGEIVKHLKSAHGMGHGYANMVAHKLLKSSASDAENPDDLIESQYAGAKSALRSIYDALVGVVRKFGKDVELAPKKAYVSLRRSKQFGIIQPSTAARLDIGINLKGTPPTDRLEASGSFNAMVSHRVRATKASEIDKELEGWLRKAYEGA